MQPQSQRHAHKRAAAALEANNDGNISQDDGNISQADGNISHLDSNRPQAAAAHTVYIRHHIRRPLRAGQAG